MLTSSVKFVRLGKDKYADGRCSSTFLFTTRMTDRVSGTLAFAGTAVQATFENNTFAFTYQNARRVHAACDILSCVQPCVPSDAREIGVASFDEQQSFTVYAVDRHHGNGLWRLIRYSFACSR